MAFDEALAERVRPVIGARPEMTEKKMFGGVAWMLGGNMAAGIVGEELLVRLDEEDRERALAEPNVHPFEMGGRTTRGFVLVGPEGVADEAELARWVDAGADYAASLPPKAR